MVLFKYRKVFWVFISCAIVFQALWFFPILHGPIPLHFNFSGDPVSWIDKSSFLRLYFIINLVLSIIYRISIKRLPSMIHATNIPNKAYWTAPERLSFTTQKLLVYLHSLWISTLLLMIFTWQFVIDASLSPEHRLSGLFFIVLICYVTYLIYMTVRYFKSFS